MRYEMNLDAAEIGKRKKKIANSFACKALRDAEEFPVIVSTPNYFAFGADERAGYFDDPETMLAFQVRGYQHHLDHVKDDFVPFFMPWYGTGVLASAFGCRIRPADPGGDPGVMGPCVHTIEDAKRMRVPDPYKDGWMPKVLDCIEFARKHSNLPVGPTDLNSPLNSLALICGYDNLFIWMYEEPALVHDMMSMVCEAFIGWVKTQKEYTGEPWNASNGLQGVWSPEGVGVWMSDDDLVSMSAELYAEFVVPYYSRIFETFGGGSLHYCGKGNQHMENFKNIAGLKAINNSPMGHDDEFARLAANRPEGVMIQIQDSLPLAYDTYYQELFEALPNLDGMLVATWVLDHYAMANDGGYMSASWNATDAANNAVRAIRAAVGRKLGQGS